MRIGKLLVNHPPALALPRSAFFRGRMRVSKRNPENDIQKPYGRRIMRVLILNSRVHAYQGRLSTASWDQSWLGKAFKTHIYTIIITAVKILESAV